MKKLYNQEYLKDLLLIFEDDMRDLQKWSTYNDDKGANEICEWIIDFGKLKKLLLKEETI